MDNSPFFSPNAPRFAPRMHVRNASESPTRKRFSDDLLSDLSPATTLEAFTNPSGKLKASIEAASPNERAFGIRATTASKKIQEWLYELSNWPWPAEGGSVGFEMPATKRRKFSDPFIDTQGLHNHQQTGMTNGDEPEYIGSMLAEEVDRYEVRIEDIQTEMEDLNVEDIKRQVLDTHFSPRSRPSSSASNAPPMPQFLSSYTKMDDFTAIVTSTVLQSLPNLSRLMRLMDVWSVRLSVLRKVPPLLLALEDAEIALKSGWNAIREPTSDDEHLTRDSYGVMRNVLREKVTTLGQDLDFLLDTLEGREDTLPEIWLDRMEAIENDYGSWDVVGERKVREGEWAELAKGRKEEEDARKLLEAQQAEAARLKAEQEAREEAERIALQEAADGAQRKVEQEVRELAEAEAARLQAIRDAEEAAKVEIRMETEALEAARLEAELEAAREEAERLQVQRDSEIAAQLQAEQDAQEIARHQAEEEATRLNLQQKAEQEAARSRALQEAEDLAMQEAGSARIRADEEARNLVQCQAEDIEWLRLEQEDAARLKASKDIEDLDRVYLEEQAANIKVRQREQEVDRARTITNEEDLAIQPVEVARTPADQDAEDLAQHQTGTAEVSRQMTIKEAEDAALERVKREPVFDRREEEVILDSFRLEADAAQDDVASPTAIDDYEGHFERSKPEAGIAEAAIQMVKQQFQQLTRSEAEKLAEESAIRQARKAADQAEIATLEVGRDLQDPPLKAYQESQRNGISLSQGAQPIVETPQIEIHTVKQELQGQSSKADVKPNQDEVFNPQNHSVPLVIKMDKEVHHDNKSQFKVKQPCEHTSAETVNEKAVGNALNEPSTSEGEEQSTVTTSEDTKAAAKTNNSSRISKQSEDSPIFTSLQDGNHSTALEAGIGFPMGSVPSTFVLAPPSGVSDAVGYSTFDGIQDGDQLPTSTGPRSRKETILDSPVHLNGPSSSALDSQPTTPLKTTIENQGVITPVSQKPPRLGHAFATTLPASSSSSASSVNSPQPSGQSHDYSSPVGDLKSRKTPVSRTSPDTPALSLDGAHDSRASQTLSTKSNDGGWVVITSDDEEPVESTVRPNPETSIGSISRPASLALGCSTADPTPNAQPAGFFQPTLSPIMSDRSFLNDSGPITPLEAYERSPTITIEDTVSALDGPSSPVSPFLSSPGLKALPEESMSLSQLELGGDELDLNETIDRPTSLPVLAHKQSIPRMSTSLRRISIPRKDSTSSETTVMDRLDVTPSSPIASPTTDNLSDLSTQADASPSAGRIRLRNKNPYDFTQPGSPRLASKLSPQRSLQNLQPIPSRMDIATPITPIEAPTFDSLDVTTTLIISSPKSVTTDEQIQQQISSLLENIPARIRLTSEPASSIFNVQTLRPKKVRRSITPTPRSSSSMSNYSTSTSYTRATTPGPQFTLAPAFAKTGHRTRVHNGNPEIKLYHLSRSTGEAPIKLFVRLVGEHGERVMVRVGGGWADLGEYLKEYASHHGRRSAADAGGKVEIQDLPPRIASNSSTTSTVHGGGRDTPVPRPFSVLERERPMSSLNVRKTRKSIGDHDVSALPSRIYDTRSPSTPLPQINRRAYETPPSVASSASGTGSNGRSSRMSWTEEDSSLGLAGPKSKKIVISERDQEWVESMKEKVRLASAEKERKERHEREREQGGTERIRGASFGEMDKVGGTKRLFRKGL